MCDNAGEFISDLAMAMYDTYDLTLDPIAPHAPQSGGLWEKTVGDVKRRSTTNFIISPWMPMHLWLISDEYASLQMYVIEYSPNPNGESPYEMEHGFPPDWESLRLRTWGASVQFKDV